MSSQNHKIIKKQENNITVLIYLIQFVFKFDIVFKKIYSDHNIKNLICNIIQKKKNNKSNKRKDSS